MKLKTLKLKNFRGYTTETEINTTDLNVLIGKNDVGKSSIIEALDIFFNGKPDKNDLSVNHDNSTIQITCIFHELPEQLVLDDSVETTLEEEFLCNLNGDLEIQKVFSISSSGSVSEEAFIICEHPEQPELTDLLSKKRTTLKLLAEELKTNTENISKTKSKELRSAIRNHFLTDETLQTTTTKIKIDGKLDNEDNRKKIWTSIKKYLPIYSLFFVDKPLNDQDSDIQDPMKEIIKEVLKRKEIEPLLSKLKDSIQQASTDLADKTIGKLNELDSNLAETLRSNFPKEPTWNSIFKLTLEDDRGIPLNKRGSGMRRLVLLSFFRAQIENRRTSNAPNIIYALEEPETSQHPDFQLMIVNALKELAVTDNAQVLFTTHNSNLAKEIPKSSLRYIYSDNNETKIESGTHSDGTDNKEIIDRIIETLGALPDPRNKVKVIVCVEGQNDINGLIRFSKLLNAHDETIINLENNDSVAFIPVGGSQLKFYIDNKYLDNFTQSQVHIYDSDNQDYIIKVQQLNDENNPKKIGFNTTKRELENYLHPTAIMDCYGDNNIKINVADISDNEDVPLNIAKAVHQASGTSDWESINKDPIKTQKSQEKKVSKVKKNLNTVAIEKMTIEQLKERNGYDEIKGWLEQIQKFNEI